MHQLSPPPRPANAIQGAIILGVIFHGDFHDLVLGGIVGKVLRYLLNRNIILGPVNGRNQNKILALQKIDLGDMVFCFAF